MNSPGRGNKLGAIASFSLFLFGNLADAYPSKVKHLRALHLILAGTGILYLFFAFSNYYGWLTFSL